MYNRKNSFSETDHVYLPEIQKLEATWEALTDDAARIHFALEHVAAHKLRISVSRRIISPDVRL